MEEKILGLTVAALFNFYLPPSYPNPEVHSTSK
jgi:hypothetical protein